MLLRFLFRRGLLGLLGYGLPAGQTCEHLVCVGVNRHLRLCLVCGDISPADVRYGLLLSPPPSAVAEEQAAAQAAHAAATTQQLKPRRPR